MELKLQIFLFKNEDNDIKRINQLRQKTEEYVIKNKNDFMSADDAVG